MKWAFLGYPHAGGTHTVFRHLRLGLADHGIAIRWIGSGPSPMRDNTYTDCCSNERDFGEIVGGDLEDELACAKALADHLVRGNFDGVFVNVLSDRVQTNAVRFLPESLKRIMIVHSISPGTYAAARAMREYVHATIGVSPRIREDLSRSVGFGSTSIFAICNACDFPTRLEVPLRTSRNSPIGLVSLGRIDDSSKGVFWIPQIMARVRELPIKLTIAGDGPDAEPLRRRCEALHVPATFIGRVNPIEARELFSQNDLFLFPSRYEGFGITLLEAMQCGCVPVATYIRGVTDYIIRDGIDGRLFPVGSVRRAAKIIRELSVNRDKLLSMSLTCQRRVTECFTVSKMATQYRTVILDAMSSSHRVRRLDWSDWHYPAGLKSTLRTALPLPVKNLLRTVRSRLS